MKTTLVIMAIGAVCLLSHPAFAQERPADQRAPGKSPVNVIGEEATRKTPENVTSQRHRTEINQLLAQYKKEQREADQKLAALRAKLEAAAKELEGKDRMGNFEIQRLMSAFNQAETLASSVLKKRDDAATAIINKL